MLSCYSGEATHEPSQCHFWLAKFHSPLEPLREIVDAGSRAWLEVVARVLLFELAGAREFDKLGVSSEAGALRFWLVVALGGRGV